MDVKCTVVNENVSIGDPQRNIEVSSVFANGSMAEIEVGGVKVKVVIDEMVSALEKCKLNCFGR